MNIWEKCKLGYSCMIFKGLKNEYNRVTRNKKCNTYYDKINNNMLVFTPYAVEDDETDIVNSTHRVYDYLVNTLNNTTGIVVHWTKVEGTTSDFVIYYDYDPREFINNTYREVVKTLREVTNEHVYCKFVEIKDGKSSPVTYRDEGNE